MSNQFNIWSVAAKGLNTYVNERFQFLIFNTFANISKNMFSLCHYGLVSVDSLAKMDLNTLRPL